VSDVRLGTIELDSLFKTKQLVNAASTAELLVDLAAAGTRAAGAASKGVFHG
jgi:hypothetical protein